MALSTEISKNQINLLILGDSDNKLVDFCQYLSSEHAPFLHKIDQKSSGMYVVRFKKITDALKLNVLETIIQEKCGSVACRIFRLLKEKKKLDDKIVI